MLPMTTPSVESSCLQPRASEQNPGSLLFTLLPTPQKNFQQPGAFFETVGKDVFPLRVVAFTDCTHAVQHGDSQRGDEVPVRAARFENKVTVIFEMTVTSQSRLTKSLSTGMLAPTEDL
jgi:hypothetical protein